MLSVVVLAADARVRVSATPDAIVRTLGSLVPAVVDGLIRDVALAAVAGSQQAREIADHSGCAFAEAPDHEGVLRAGLAAVRGDLVFVITAGRAPEAGLIDEIARLFDTGVAPRAAIARAAPERFFERVFPALCGVEAAIVRKSLIGEPAASLSELRRQLGSPAVLRRRLYRVM